LPITSADMLLADSLVLALVLLVAAITVRAGRWLDRSDMREGTTSRLKRSQRYSEESALPPGFRTGNGTRYSSPSRTSSSSRRPTQPFPWGTAKSHSNTA
jgi:hypothetical protein